MKIIKNVSFFANAGIGEFGTSHAQVQHNNETYKVHTILANELLQERAEIFSLNYPETDMVIGSITDELIMSNLIKKSNGYQPISATVSPPCQGSSGLNAFKYQKHDFRNQLIKSFLQFLNSYKGIEFGYIENVLNYYQETIPGLVDGKICLDYIQDGKSAVHGNYILLTNNQEFCQNNSGSELVNNLFEKKYFVVFEQKPEIYPEDSKWVEPINLKDYIQKALLDLGYSSEYNVVRGEEYGSPQIRQRGFLIFYKKEYKFSYPRPLFNTSKASKQKIYNGKTILDALLCKKLLEKVEPEILNKKGYKDLSIPYEQYIEHYPNKINFHYTPKINPRHKFWLSHTPEGSSCYFNQERYTRPYKIQEITLNSNKSNQVLIVENDIAEDWIQKGIIDFQYFVPEWMKKEEKDFINGRNWKIEKISNRNWISQRMQDFAVLILNKSIHDLNEKFPELESYSQAILKLEHKKLFVFMPIKGFEKATYKRANLNLPSPALTTKMGVGNSNTVHPIFDRTWSPKETMTLFGLGIKLEQGEYVSIEDYKLPTIINPKKLETLIYEICGEGIIALVAEAFMEQLVEQYLNNQ